MAWKCWPTNFTVSWLSTACTTDKPSIKFIWVPAVEQLRNYCVQPWNKLVTHHFSTARIRCVFALSPSTLQVANMSFLVLLNLRLAMASNKWHSPLDSFPGLHHAFPISLVPRPSPWFPVVIYNCRMLLRIGIIDDVVSPEGRGFPDSIALLITCMRKHEQWSAVTIPRHALYCFVIHVVSKFTVEWL